MDELHHEAIWRRWLGEDRNIDEDRNDVNDRKRVLPNQVAYPSSSSNSAYDHTDEEPVVTEKYRARLFIHAKYPDRIKSQWVRSRTLGRGRMSSKRRIELHPNKAFYEYLTSILLHFNL